MPAPGERSAAVRQAVALPHVGGDPGAAFVPGAGEALAAAGVETAVVASEQIATPEISAPEIPAPETSAPAEPRSAPEAATPSGEAAVAAAPAEVRPPAVQAMGAGAEPPDPPDTGQRFDSPGRPKKQLLAAAAIVGSLLVAVPFAVLAVNSGDGKKQTDTALAANDRTVLGNDGAVSPPGAFTPASPTHAAPVSPSASAKPKPKPTTAAARDNVVVAPAQTKAAAPKSTAKATAGAPVATAKPQAKATSTGFTGLSDVLLKNKASGHCADIPNYGNGTPNGPVREYYCRPGTGDNQMWDLDVTQKGAGPGSANLFLIRNVKDGYCMDLPNYGANGATTKVTEYHCDGSFNDNQLWWLDKRADGSYWIRNYSSNQLCLDVTGYSSTALDLNLTIYTCSDTDDQNWTFTS